MTEHQTDDTTPLPSSPAAQPTGPAIYAAWTDQDGVGPDGVELQLEDSPRPEFAVRLSSPESHRVLCVVVKAVPDEGYVSNAAQMLDGMFSLRPDSVEALHAQMTTWLAQHRRQDPPLVSILADAAEDAAAMRIRELEDRNEALVHRIAAIGASVARLPPFDANDGDTFTSAPRIDAAADLITDMEYRIDEYERIAHGSGRDLATMERLRNEAEARETSLRFELDAVVTRLEGIEESLQGLANNAFGPIPIQSATENLDVLEKGIDGLAKQVRDAKIAAARELGSKGGAARAAALSPKRRRQIAKSGGKAKAARKAKPARSRR